MNIHGYKKHKKGMQIMLQTEEAKKESNQTKILRLQKCIRNCSYKIKLMKNERKKK